MQFSIFLAGIIFFQQLVLPIVFNLKFSLLKAHFPTGHIKESYSSCGYPFMKDKSVVFISFLILQKTNLASILITS